MKLLFILFSLCFIHTANAESLQNKLQPFTSDGCSRFPDGNITGEFKWRHCCIQHDIAYWQGGTSEQRAEADYQLQKCVAATGEAFTGDLMHLGVRMGGYVGLPTSWHWGYGWTLRRGYKPLTPREQTQVNELSKQIPQDLSQIPVAEPPVIPIRPSLTNDYCLDLAVLQIEEYLDRAFEIENMEESVTEDKSQDIFKKTLRIKVAGCKEPFQFSFDLLRYKNACTMPMDEFTARSRIRPRLAKLPTVCGK